MPVIDGKWVRGKPPHPGEMLAGVLLKNYDLDVDSLAKRIHVDASGLRKVVEGRAPFTSALAISLRPVFGIAASQLFQMQQLYDFFVKNGRRPTIDERRSFNKLHLD